MCPTYGRGIGRIETVTFSETRSPGADLILEATKAHFWLTALDAGDEQLAELASLLAPDESARANRYHADRDRRAYTVARGKLRILLSAYLRCGPKEIDFVYDARGKPSISTKFSVIRDLQFNVSHSDGLAIYGVTKGLKIGVDIEHARGNIAFRALAHRFFSAEETAAIESLPLADQQQAFYACWTRKEAYLKATGHGLSRNLKSFAVSVLPGEPAALLRDNDATASLTQWALADLLVPVGYTAAAAVESDVMSARGYFWKRQEP